VSGTERGVDGESPEPAWVGELLDAARDVPEMTAEQGERLDRSLRAAIVEQRRAVSRRRRATWALAVGVVVAAGVAAATVFGLGTPARSVSPDAGARAPAMARPSPMAPVTPKEATLAETAPPLGPAVAGWVMPEPVVATAKTAASSSEAP
jgi:hypothetical protein